VFDDLRRHEAESDSGRARRIERSTVVVAVFRSNEIAHRAGWIGLEPYRRSNLEVTKRAGRIDQRETYPRVAADIAMFESLCRRGDLHLGAVEPVPNRRPLWASVRQQCRQHRSVRCLQKVSVRVRQYGLIVHHLMLG
jgi:hypothetical protein